MSKTPAQASIKGLRPLTNDDVKAMSIERLQAQVRDYIAITERLGESAILTEIYRPYQLELDRRALKGTTHE